MGMERPQIQIGVEPQQYHQSRQDKQYRVARRLLQVFVYHIDYRQHGHQGQIDRQTADNTPLAFDVGEKGTPRIYPCEYGQQEEHYRTGRGQAHGGHHDRQYESAHNRRFFKHKSRLEEFVERRQPCEKYASADIDQETQERQREGGDEGQRIIRLDIGG